MKRVEPCSLRRTRGGDVVLYACEAYTSEYLTIPTSRLSEDEVTQ